MAYSNWGAFVYCNGERRTDREDVPVFGDPEVEAAGSGMRIFVNLLRLREVGKLETSPAWERCQHAVLGSGQVRLCGYKSYPKLFVVRGDAVDELELKQFAVGTTEELSSWSWYDGGVIQGEVDGHKFTAELREDPERVELTLTEPDGTVWTGESGYCMGAGYE